jgi:hypothetical protein
MLAMLVLGFAISHFLVPALYPLVLPINPASRQPLLRDAKTGQAVYMDPQRSRYVIVDSHFRLIPVGPESIRMVQLPAGNDPSLQPPQAPSMPENNSAPTQVPKEGK